jgi:hypothetical protein
MLKEKKLILDNRRTRGFWYTDPNEANYVYMCLEYLKAELMKPLPFPEYNEDAGVFVSEKNSYRPGLTACKFAFAAMADRLIDQFYKQLRKNPEQETRTLVLVQAEAAAIIQASFWMLNNIKKLAEYQLESYWESDEHYSGKSKTEFIEQEMLKINIKKIHKSVVEKLDKLFY